MPGKILGQLKKVKTSNPVTACHNLFIIICNIYISIVCTYLLWSSYTLSNPAVFTAIISFLLAFIAIGASKRIR
ncbi:MAG: hypothetical protein O7C62_04540 [Rickettsia endosymbiont of Ixodes persulcatus]|nr:hypothetical protein [Rickettsia endosymbiont of Ixodes persulcatus]